MKPGRSLLLIVAFLATSMLCKGSAAAGQVIVLANRETPVMDWVTLQKVFLGKVIRVNGMPVIPVNLVSGSLARKDFVSQILEQTDEKYVNYWTVRRYIGQGSPPREVSGEQEMIDYVRSTPGAVGYVEEVTPPGDLVRSLARP